MLDKEAIKAINLATGIDQAQNAIAAAIEFKSLAALPDNFSTHDLEKLLPTRRRMRGQMETSVIADFARYVDAHKEEGAMVFVNADSMTAKAVLNLGTPTAPGHTDNVAKLMLKDTATYKALKSIANGGGHKQQTIAEFFEDWPGFLTFFNDDGQIQPPKAIAAVRKLTIESMRKLESEEKQLSAARSAFESVSATSAEPIPTVIYFKCEPFVGLQVRDFVMRLSINTGSDKPTIALRIVKQEQHNEEMARELAQLVQQAIPLPVLIGGYSASA